MRVRARRWEPEMRDWLKELKFHFGLHAALGIIGGVVLFIWPDMSVRIVCMMVGIILALMGAVHLMNYFGAPTGTLIRQVQLALAVVFAAVGIWIVLQPDFLAGLIPVITGILLILHGGNDFRQAVCLIRAKYAYWWLALLLAVLTVAAGCVLIWNPFQAASLAVKVIGALLVYDGISDLWIMSAARRVAGDAEMEIREYTNESEE